MSSADSSYFLQGNQYSAYSSSFSLPMLYYYLRFKTEVLAEKIDSEIIPQIKKFTNTYINTLNVAQKVEESNHQEIYFLSEIDFFIENKENNEFYLSYAEAALDSEDYSNELRRSFNLRLILGILENINHFPYELEVLLYNKLNAFFDNKDYFKPDMGFHTDNMLLVEIELLHAGNIFNKLSSKYEIVLEEYRLWYVNQLSALSDLLLVDQLDTFILTHIVNDLKILNELYSVEFNKDTYSLFIEKLKEIDFNQIIFYDYVFVFQSLMILKYDDKDNISQYYDNINNFKNLMFIHANFPGIQDQYFGLLLSQELDFDINQETYLRYIDLNGKNDMNSAYHYSLIYTKLNIEMDETAKKEIAILLEEELKRLDNLPLKEIYFLLCISDFINKPLSKQNLLEISNIIEEGSINYEIEEFFFYYVLLREKLNLEIDEKWIAENIESYYIDNSFSYIKNDKIYSNIMSAFRMISLIIKYDLAVDINMDSLLNTLEKYYGFDGGYFITNPESNGIDLIENYKDNFNLQSWYYGLYLYGYLYELLN